MSMTPPMIVAAVIGAGIIALLFRFRKKNNLQAWMRTLHAKAEHATKDPEFRREELRRTEEELGRYTPPEPVTPLTRRQEMFIQLLPKFLLFNGAGGTIMLWLGLFKPPAAGQFNWLLVIGIVLLAAVVAAIALTMPLRRHHAWLQQLNLKYLLLKAEGNFDGMMPVMDRILQYYPSVAELWLEKADQLSRYGKMDGALAAVAKARELSPGAMDIAVVEVSFMLRSGKLLDAERGLKTMSEMPKAPTDPRVEIYLAQLALLKNELTKAKKHAETATKLDASFTTQFLDREESLKQLKTIMREEKLIF